MFNEYTWKGLFHIIHRDTKEFCLTILHHRYLILIVLCMIKLILQVFSLVTILTVVCLIYSTKAYITQIVEEVLEKGVAYYLPIGLKNALLNRSLLDILCDMWFIPTLSLYVKTIMAPMLSSKRRGPEDAVKYLDALEPNQKKVFITKGLAFLFPRKVTKILLPRDYFQNPILGGGVMKKETFLSNGEDGSDDESTMMILPSKETQKLQPIESESLRMLPSMSNNREIAITTKQPAQIAAAPVVKSLRAVPLPSASNPQHSLLQKSPSKNNLIKVINVANPASQAVVKKSKVILSSHMLKNLKNMPGRIDPSWDNITEYNRRRVTGLIPRSHSSDKLDILKLIFNIKKLQFLKKVNRGTAVKVSAGAAVAVLAQLLLFKKTRKWTKTILLLMTFTGGLTILFGSLMYLVLQSKLGVQDKVDQDRDERDTLLAIRARVQEEEAADNEQDNN